MDSTEADALKLGNLWLGYWRRKTMGQRDSVMIQIEGVDGTRPRLVARADLINTLAEMAQSDLLQAHSDLGISIYSTGGPYYTEQIEDDIGHFYGHVGRDQRDYISMEARGLLGLLEQHTRAVNALQALLSLRDPDELVEAHMP